MTEWTWLEGYISVEAAIRGQSRALQQIFIQDDKRDRKLMGLAQTARKAGIEIEYVPVEFIAARAKGKSHGGVIAQAGPRRFITMADLVTNSSSPWIVMLDGIEDPFNFGQAVRAVYAAGVDGLVVGPRNWFSAAGIVARSSAGASELIPTAVTETALTAADFFRKRGLRIVCTAEKQSRSIFEVHLTTPMFLLIGGEKRGITRSFLKKADLTIQIPYGRRFDRSLGAATAAAIIGFEVMRQRTK